jgi:Ion transport protein
MSQIVRQRRKLLANLYGHSLYILSPTNYYRKFCLYIFNQKYFEDLSNIFVLLSTILLAVDNPLDDPDSLKQKILSILDMVMTSVFSFEAVIKISVFGLLLNGKKSYLRELWNILDFFVVTVSILSYLPINANLSFYRAMRLLRIMRPLRMIQRN